MSFIKKNGLPSHIDEIYCSTGACAYSEIMYYPAEIGYYLSEKYLFSVLEQVNEECEDNSGKADQLYRERNLFSEKTVKYFFHIVCLQFVIDVRG